MCARGEAVHCLCARDGAGERQPDGGVPVRSQGQGAAPGDRDRPAHAAGRTHEGGERRRDHPPARLKGQNGCAAAMPFILFVRRGLEPELRNVDAPLDGCCRPILLKSPWSTDSRPFCIKTGQSSRAEAKTSGRFSPTLVPIARSSVSFAVGPRSFGFLQHYRPHAAIQAARVSGSFGLLRGTGH
jgi:hypothetical protein